MFENPRRGTQARNFTTNVPKILVLKSSSEQIFSRNLPLGAPELSLPLHVPILLESAKSSRPHVFESFLPVIEYPFLSSIHFCRIDWFWVRIKSTFFHSAINVWSIKLSPSSQSGLRKNNPTQILECIACCPLSSRLMIWLSRPAVK